MARIHLSISIFYFFRSIENFGEDEIIYMLVTDHTRLIILGGIKTMSVWMVSEQCYINSILLVSNHDKIHDIMKLSKEEDILILVTDSGFYNERTELTKYKVDKKGGFS